MGSRSLTLPVLFGLFSSSLFAAEAVQNRLLNVIDQPSFPGIAAWMVNNVTAKTAEAIKPVIGSAAVEITGVAKTPGAKVDAPAYNGDLNCQTITVWANPRENVDTVGFQVADANGEWLLETVKVNWEDWRQITIDPTAGGMKQAYEQRDQNGKVDLPIKSVHLIWFAKAQGTTAMRFDGLSAAIPFTDEGRVVLTTPGTEVIEPGQPLAIRLVAENRSSADVTVTGRYMLQANPSFAEPVVPDPVLGFDHALGAKTSVSVDDADRGDAKFCDGSEFTGFETPWGAGYKEVVATVDLGQVRDVSAIQWMAGDANWVWKADVLASTDGNNFSPVPGAQGVDMHAKWAGPHSIPVAKPTQARHLRFRFHKDGESVNCFRLPVSIMVYDGVANDTVEIPAVGEQVTAGAITGAVKARDFSELAIDSEEPLGPGAYLLSMEMEVGGKKDVRLAHLFVKPADEVPADSARRFGINGANTSLEMAQSMRRVGFGWMRYENAKWAMYMPAKDKAGFTGTTAPWHLNFDTTFSQYQKVGLKVLGYVFQTPEWATSAPTGVEKNRMGYPPKDPADYGDALFQLVARYGRNKVDPSLLKSDDKRTGLGWLDAVELWNEPNLSDPGWGPFVGPMKQYFEVMRAGVEGARKADPGMTITAGGLAGIGLETVGLLAEHKYADGKTPLDLVDVINVHFYSGREEPETAGWDPNVNRNGPSTSGTTYPEQLEALVAWREHHKPKAEIWMTETGNDVGGPIGLSERHQAAKIPRGMIIALAAGVERVFIYRESGSTPSMHAGAGLIRNDGTIRPSWVTVATMIRQLQGFDGPALRLSTADPNVWAYLFENGDRRVIAAWTLGEPVKLALAVGAGKVCDSFGHTTEVADAAEVQLGYFPVYVSLTQPTSQLTSLVAEARDRAQKRTTEMKKLSEVPMALFDFGSMEHVGMLMGYGLPRRFTGVTKESLWDAQRGYGFTVAAAGDDDRHWIDSALDRDGCRVGPNSAFRFQLNKGKHRVRVRAHGINEQAPTDVLLKTSAGLLTKTMSGSNPIVEFEVNGDGKPVEVSLKEWGIIRWISAVPASE